MGKSITAMLSELQTDGWTVTFPAFGQTRAMVVKITKGDQLWQRGWVAENDLNSALLSLVDQVIPKKEVE